MMPSIYGNAYEIVQAPGFVAIRMEMVHETRVIPLNGQPHPGKDIRLDMGDPRGRWEGDTLVVETTNFRDRSVYQNANPDSSQDRRAVHAHRPENGALAGHRGRPDDVDEAVDVCHAADTGQLAAVPGVRVP